jgi:hypothetical protein
MYHRFGRNCCIHTWFFQIMIPITKHVPVSTLIVHQAESRNDQEAIRIYGERERERRKVILS